MTRPQIRRTSETHAVHTVRLAREGLIAIAESYDDPTFCAASDKLVDQVLSCRGRIVLTGLGKSGIIARKIAATFIATGTPAVYLHPSDADLGAARIVDDGDLILIIGGSYEMSGLEPLIAHCANYRIPLAMITTSQQRSLDRLVDCLVRLPRAREACQSQFSPTTTTTQQLVFGDALAMTVMDRRGFSVENFHDIHPSGMLGAHLRLVSDIMARGLDVPRVAPHDRLIDAIMEINRARCGATAVVDPAGSVVGVFTDGDLSRAVAAGAVLGDPVTNWMSRVPVTIGARELTSKAVSVMESLGVKVLFVVDGASLTGVVHLHHVMEPGAVA